MTKRLIPMGILSIVVLALVLTGCKAPNTPVKSSAVVLRASAVGLGLDSHDSFPVPGGSLVVDTAAVNIAEFRIQENSGPDSGGDGENGGQGEGDQPDSSDQELPDIVVPGPFLLQIAAGETFIDTVAVYPGTFRQVDAAFAVSPLPPLIGKSIYITGTYQSVSGPGVPLVLKSEFHGGTECPIPGGGFIIPSDTTVALSVEFDVAGWFAELDMGSAELTNGVILIDSGHNPSLLAAFEAVLSGEGEGGEGGADTDTLQVEEGGGEH
jgi:hypothetical protein